MRDIANLTVTQIRIFAPDVLPFRQLSSQTGVEIIKRIFEARNFGANAETGELIFQNGSLRLGKDLPDIWVPLLTIDPRRIGVQVLGSSAEATVAFGCLLQAAAILLKTSVEEISRDPVFFSEETSCVAELEFSWEELFAPKVRPFVNELIENSEAGGLSPFLRSVGFRFALGIDASTQLNAEGVVVSERYFVIESRADVPLSRNRFYTSSPSSSDAHLKLIEKFESEITRKGRKALKS